MEKINIKELKYFLQKDKRQRMKKMWGHTFINQNAAFYLTYFLIKTKIPITPNQITIIFTILGIIGAILLFQPSFWLKMIGLFTCWMNLVLDGVDGDYARYKKIFSLKGIYVDAINHIIVPPLFLLGIGFGLINYTNLNISLIIGSVSIGAISWAGLKMISNLPFHLHGRHFIKDPQKYLTNEEIKNKKNIPININKQKSLFRRLLGIRFQFRQYFIAIIIFLITLIFDKFSGFHQNEYFISSWTIILYSIFITTQFLEEFIKGYFSIEKLVKNIYFKN